MKAQFYVTMERLNAYVGKKGPVKERILTLCDAEEYAGQQVPATLDYTLSPDEEAAHPPKSLNNCTVVFGVSEIGQWNGRPRLRGAIGEVLGRNAQPKPAKA